MTEPEQPLSRRAAREAERLAAEAQHSAATQGTPPDGDPAPTEAFTVEPPLSTAGFPMPVYTPQRAFSATPEASSTVEAEPAPAFTQGAVAAGAASEPLTERLSAWFVRHKLGVKLTAAGAALLALCVGAVAAGVASVPPPAPVVADSGPSARVVPEIPAGFARARSCVIDIADAELAMLGATVVNAETGETLLDLAGADAVGATNEVKLMTAAVAATTLGSTSTLSTRVYEGSVKGTIVIVAGGDPTLSALPDGSQSVYSGAPRIAALAEQTIATLDSLYPPVDDDDDDDDDERRPGGGRGNGPDSTGTAAVTPGYEITQIVVDVGLWGSADRWPASWPESARTTGIVAPVAPLMIDGAREDPTTVVSPRSADPVTDAVNAFVTALDLPSKPAISTGSALSGAKLLGEVNSQPVSTLISQMLQLDDNTLAEALGRVASARSGAGGTAASLGQLFQSLASDQGVDATGMVIADASGVSAESLVPPATLAGLFAKIATDAEVFGVVRSALPVAGVSGPFLDRFTAADATVRSSFAGLGTPVAAADSLGGILSTADGAVLALSLQASGAVTAATTTELEAIVSRIKACGDNLAGVAQPAGQ